MEITYSVKVWEALNKYNSYDLYQFISKESYKNCKPTYLSRTSKPLLSLRPNILRFVDIKPRKLCAV